MRNKHLIKLAILIAGLSTVLLTGCNDAKLSRSKAQHVITATVSDIVKERVPKDKDKLNERKIREFKDMVLSSLLNGDGDGRKSLPISGFDSFFHSGASGISDFNNRTPRDKASFGLEDYTYEALAQLGYITVQPSGPLTVKYDQSPSSTHFDKSRVVNFTPRAEVGTDSTKMTSDNVFYCYAKNTNGSQCNLPAFTVEHPAQFKITGIVQDDATHAKVRVLIPWELTPFAKELKPIAARVDKQRLSVLGTDYYKDFITDSWPATLSRSADSGAYPATVLFQRYDDGWRIVDSNGQSVKDQAL